MPRSGTVHLKIAVRPAGTCVSVYSKTLSKIEKKEEIVSKKERKELSSGSPLIPEETDRSL